jgi:uncharacterized protein
MLPRVDFPVWKTVFIGLLAGLLAGIFGVGGGFLMVPLFVLLLGMAQKRAHATSLFAVLFISIAALSSYANLKAVDWVAAGFVSLGAVAGIFLGVKLLARISERGLSYIFAGVLIGASARLLWSATPHQIFDGAVAKLLLIVIGFAAGALAGLLGVGGGIIIVPSLILCSGVEPNVARGTSLAIIIVTSLVGTTLHHRLGTIDHKIAVVAGLAGVPAAVLGAHLSAQASNHVLIPMFCLVLFILAGQLILRKQSH